MWHGDSDKPAGVIIIVVAGITIIIIGSSYNSAFRNHVRPSGSLTHATGSAHDKIKFNGRLQQYWIPS